MIRLLAVLLRALGLEPSHAELQALERRLAAACAELGEITGQTRAAAELLDRLRDERREAALRIVLERFEIDAGCRELSRLVEELASGMNGDQAIAAAAGPGIVEECALTVHRRLTRGLETLETLQPGLVGLVDELGRHEASARSWPLLARVCSRRELSRSLATARAAAKRALDTARRIHDLLQALDEWLAVRSG